MTVRIFSGEVRNLETRIGFQRGKGRCVTYCFDINAVECKLLGDLIPEGHTANTSQALFEGDEVRACCRKIIGGKWLALSLKAENSSSLFYSYDPSWLKKIILVMFVFGTMDALCAWSVISAWISSDRFSNGAFMLVPSAMLSAGLIGMGLILNDVRQARRKI